MTLEEISGLLSKAKDDLAQASSPEDIETLRLHYLGRKQGIVNNLTTELSGMQIEDKRVFGPVINNLKKEIESLFTGYQPKSQTSNQLIFDITAPAKKPPGGHLHPTTQVISEIKDIFRYLGFSFIDGPEAETDIYNFQKLRLHPDHPARDTQQTYYLSENQKTLLRTHTSPMQIRYMENHKPPLRILSPGRVYRRDQIDSTHLPSFYQLEGLLVDQDTKMSDLIGILSFFAKRMFGAKSQVRVYGHNFPYTEPSIELEVFYPKLNKWVEMLGAGMVHPEVLEGVGIDPTVYRGWAFGMGPERIAMLKYGIEDIRHFYQGDLRFLKQF